MALEDYQRKRNFGRTPEPKGRSRKQRATALQFVVQKHAARRLHYDFRLELDGVLKSWAVPKGPSLVAGEKRMAVETEDHPLEYASFEGVIPKGEYGGGTVQVWDRGSWEALEDPHAGLAKGHLSFRLAGDKLRGAWHLVRMRARRDDGGRVHWLLIKSQDAEARPRATGEITEHETDSVLTGRGIEEIARDADRVWHARGANDDDAAKVGDVSTAPGAKRAPLPRSFAVQLATLADAAPDGDDWIHEIKLDGYRLVCRIENGHARLTTRTGRDWTRRFAKLAKALEALPVEDALLDGEAVVFDAEGRSRFQLLQNALGEERSVPHLVLFDLLHLDGHDLRGVALTERKRLLRHLLAKAPSRGPLRYSDHVRGSGPAFFDEVCRRGVEGVVSKRADGTHHAGRSRAWLKVKCVQRQEFVVVGYTAPAGTRVGFGALLLGAYDEEGALRYCGKVGTGFDTATLARLHRKLASIARKTPSVVDPKRAERGAHWVAPELVAEVRYGEWTDDGKLRHPAFLGLRADKKPEDVRIERTVPVETAGAPPPIRSEVAGVRLSNPDRVYWPDLGVTKSELALYYEAAAERMLPGLRDRPLTLVRCPEGIEGHHFYQKHAGKTVPERVPRVVVEKGEAPYAMVDDLGSLISLVQIGVLELHVGGARADRLDRPDHVVFDLDPDPAVPWSRVADTARLLRRLLDELGLAAFVRTTGGKGLHVVTPLARRASWDSVKAFTRAIAELLVEQAPDRFTAVMSKKKRTGRIFIDHLRNAPGATAVASYSTRARPGAPIAVPLAWEEIEGRREPPRWGLRDMPKRLRDADPWQAFDASRRPLGREILRRVGVVD